jgi:hypothetical protein
VSFCSAHFARSGALLPPPVACGLHRIHNSSYSYPEN